ncbi:putative thiamine transport system permease protein [Ensifer adhaerens]|uniref:Thiamine transport system permease protein n=1 Tax=Ensifer adhaerens TaxID=106592 RepID=A0ACC5SWB9_ENSAD|nr:ABC transporter permease [Ensifer adhaerens]MBP1873108.1 putative thiamine transport system permease protein [Ensifer adhaerens]
MKSALHPHIGTGVTVVLCLPVLAGLAGTLLPAFGYLPALGGTQVTFQHFEALAAQPHILRSALISLAAGLTSTFVALVVVATFVAGFAGTRPFAFIQHLLSPLLAVPHAASAFAIAFLIAPSGFLLRIISPELTGFTRPPDWLIPNDPLGLSMISGLVAKEIPFLLLVMLAALPQLPVANARRLMTALGFNRVSGFAIALWPLLYRQVRLPVFAVLVYSTSVVDVSMILGPQLPPTLPVRIAHWLADDDIGARFLASAGAVLQLALGLLAIAIWIGVERLGRICHRRLSSSGKRLGDDRLLRLAAASVMATSAAFIFIGLGLLALWSIAGLWPFPDRLPTNLTFKTWERALETLAAPLATTIAIALLSSLVALAIAIGLLSRSGHSSADRWLPVFLPLLVPEIAFVFGLQILAAMVGVSPSIATVAAMHLVFVLPYVLLSLGPPWRALDRRYEQIASGLGKSPLAILVTIRLPMLLRACLTAFAVGFAVSVSLYLPTVLIGAGRVTTITTEAVALSSGGDRRVIGVYALLQALLPFLGFLVASLVPQLLFRHRRAMRI